MSGSDGGYWVDPRPLDAAEENAHQEKLQRDTLRLENLIQRENDEERYTDTARSAFATGFGLSIIAVEGGLYLGSKAVFNNIKQSKIDSYNRKISYLKDRKMEYGRDVFFGPSTETFERPDNASNISVPERSSFSTLISEKVSQKAQYQERLSDGVVGASALVIATLMTGIIASNMLDYIQNNNIISSLSRKVSQKFVRTFGLYEENKNHFKDYSKVTPKEPEPKSGTGIAITC